MRSNRRTVRNGASLEFTASISSAYQLSTSKVKLDELNDHFLCLYIIVKHWKMVRKLWKETRVLECRSALNKIWKTIAKGHFNDGKYK
jgi:hypothetical protein